MTEQKLASVRESWVKEVESQIANGNPEWQSQKMDALSDTLKAVNQKCPDDFPDENDLLKYLTKTLSHRITEKFRACVRPLEISSGDVVESRLGAVSMEMSIDPADLGAARESSLDKAQGLGIILDECDLIALECALWRSELGCSIVEIAANMGGVYQAVYEYYEIDKSKVDMRRRDQVSTKAVRSRILRIQRKLRLAEYNQNSAPMRSRFTESTEGETN